jgi:hypothetical protein
MIRYRLELENAGAAIRGNTEPLIGPADALGRARTLQALYLAACAVDAVELS